MKILTLIICYVLLNGPVAFSQKTDNPIETAFVTSDIDNFWLAFDKLESGYKGNPFSDYYIKNGSPGIEAFMNGRIMNADSLLNMVKKNKTKYLEKRNNTMRILDYKKQCLSTFMALKYLYPKSVFPPVYFVVGRFNSGGHSHKNGLVIGAEMNEASKTPYTVAHELIHYQQQIPEDNGADLLTACLLEGGADFIGELISGGGLSSKTYNYGNANEEKLWKEFQTIMHDKDNNHDWIYNYNPKNGYPPDLGYWIGYKITEAYYNKALDKHKAISDILNIKDFDKFLSDSGYATKFRR
jgi:uncharacterized protein YjaZ